ncbi:MAG: hypothetical protein EBQ98_02915 [Actinobacteria bacterium]|nr:hypothetical protein [Actinomycetota bacterium]
MISKSSSPSGKPQISFEFFPPKDETGQATLEKTVSELGTYSPAFVSVTYGAGGTTRDRSLKTAAQIKQSTGVPIIGHLTCVGATRDELVSEIRSFESAGLDGVLALRGDPVGGPAAPWTTTENGLAHADELVQLVGSVSSLPVGVAAFPDIHPASHGNLRRTSMFCCAKKN